METRIHEGTILKRRLREEELHFALVASKLGISRQTLYNHFLRPTISDGFYNSVKKIYPFLPEKEVLFRREVSSDQPKQILTREIMLLKAQIKALTHIAAKLMAKVTERDVLACQEELEQDVKLFYKELNAASTNTVSI